MENLSNPYLKKDLKGVMLIEEAKKVKGWPVKILPKGKKTS